MANKGVIDKDLGLNEILKEMKKLGKLAVKVGIVEGSGEQQDGVSIAQYATWNEYGVAYNPATYKGPLNMKGHKWLIPPRPFIRGWVENNQAQIEATQERLVKQVSGGKMDADTANGRLGKFGQDGIKRFIKAGNFTPNSDITINGTKPGKDKKKLIKGKKSSRPLIDTKTMLNSIRYEVIKSD